MLTKIIPIGIRHDGTLDCGKITFDVREDGVYITERTIIVMKTAKMVATSISYAKSDYWNSMSLETIYQLGREKYGITNNDLIQIYNAFDKDDTINVDEFLKERKQDVEFDIDGTKWIIKQSKTKDYIADMYEKPLNKDTISLFDLLQSKYTFGGRIPSLYMDMLKDKDETIDVNIAMAMIELMNN